MTDQHTLYIHCEGIAKDQLESFLDQALNRIYDLEYIPNVECHYRLNYIIDKQGIPLGISYFFITDPLVYYILLGKDNLDLKFPKLAKRAISDLDLETTINSKKVGIFQVFTSDISPHLHPNILTCKNVPRWISRDDLKAEFTPFVSDPTVKYHHKAGNRTIESKYPFVTINNDRTAFIKFNPDSTDAQFALYIMKRAIYDKILDDGKMNSVVLYFSQARKNKN